MMFFHSLIFFEKQNSEMMIRVGVKIARQKPDNLLSGLYKAEIETDKKFIVFLYFKCVSKNDIQIDDEQTEDR